MINRTLIRQKTVQVLYAYFLRQNTTPGAAEKELTFSLTKAYDLYNSLLLLLPELMYYASNRIEMRRARQLPTEEDLHPNMRFVENQLLNQLAVNTQLNDYKQNLRHLWSEQDEFVRRLFEKIEKSPLYADYMAKPFESYDEDREFVRRLYKTFVVGNDEMDELFEEQSLYWNDDKTIVDTFVMKTIRQFDPANGADQPLLPDYRDDEDRTFGAKLLRKAISSYDSYNELIDTQLVNWDKERVAFMDRVIMVIALAELTSFPAIPVTVTLNEYVEIAKYYSTPKSAQFINGILDRITKALQAEGKLVKNAEKD